MAYDEIAAVWPLLSLLQLVPLLAGLLLIWIRGKQAIILALIASFIEIALALVLYLNFDNTQAAGVMQFAENLPIWAALQYHMAVDGMSVLFILLTTLLGFLCVVFILFRRLHASSVLSVMMLIQASLVSQLVTMDLLWFNLLSMLEILLVAYLTKRWPASDDVMPALVRFLQFMAVGLILLSAGTLLFGWSHAYQYGFWSFDIYRLATVEVPEDMQGVLFFLLFYGLAVRIPMFPFHGWLPDFLRFGNVAIAPIYLLGLKLGVYGLLRFVLPLMPNAVWQWHYVAVAFAMVGVFYAALLALKQQNMRSLLGFAVVSHTSILTIGLFSLDPLALQGSVLLAVNFGLAISGLLLMTGLVWQRTHTTDLHRLGGMFDYIPLVGIAFLIAGLAIVGMPGTPGFNAVHFVLEGAIKTFGAPVTIAASIGNLIAAGFLLRAFQRVFLSKPSGNTSHWNSEPSQLTEKVLAGTVIFVIVVVGFYDVPWLTLIAEPVGGVGELFNELRAISGMANHE
ncbi:MAG: NADH-quinone oxidoreductase subunit M [Thiolinea sp.]